MNFRFPRWWKSAVVTTAFLLLAGTAKLSVALPASSRRSANLRLQQSRQREMQRTFAAKLKEIVRFCRSKQLLPEAALVQALSKLSAEKRFRYETLPRKVQSEISRTLPEDERIWRIDLRKAQRDYANNLYALSRRALRAGFPSYAYQLIREVGRNNSDHIAARRLLGYVRDGDAWVTSYEKSKTDHGYVWHKKFGWLPKSHVEKYNNGQRYYRRRGTSRGRWIRADREATLRRDFRNAWQIRTEHYLVKTDHSLERGVEVARLLENYYRYFFQTFAGFFNSREQMRKLFAGTATNRGRSRVKPYVVHYYRTKQEYVDKLRVKIPQIAITNGLYLTGTRKAYFFHTPGRNNNPTLYHEATHQIFYESLRRERMVGQRKNFWIIEGIACYMESFKQQRGRVSLGDPAYQRFVAAKIRLLSSRYYVPLARFTRMGMQAFQTDRNIRQNYSQASGMAKFFMEYDGGRYRDALIEHLSQLYRVDPKRYVRVQTLEELTGSRYAELDRQYADFIRNSNIPDAKIAPNNRR